MEGYTHAMNRGHKKNSLTVFAVIFSGCPIGLYTKSSLGVSKIRALIFVWMVICALANLIF